MTDLLTAGHIMFLVQETLKAMTEDVMRRRAFIRSVLEAATVRRSDQA